MTACDAIYAVLALGPVSFVAGWIFGNSVPWPSPNLGRNRHGRNAH